MEITDKDKDRFVVLTLKPEWGRGKIRSVKEGRAYILFESDPDRIERKFSLYSDVLKLSENQDSASFKGKAKGVRSGLSKKTPKVLPRIELTVLLNTFKTKYPGGFDDPIYREDLKKGERAYKEAVMAYFKENFLNDNKMKQAVERKDALYLKEHSNKLFGKSLNLPAPQEIISLRNALENEAYTLELFEALIKVLEDSEIRQETMAPYLEVFNHTPVVGFAKWPLATLFPFLAQPERHMFLKPEATKNFAGWVGWELNYDPRLNWRTYSSLLEMTKKYLEELKPYGAKDIIDLQSFIWVCHNLTQEPKVKKTAADKTEPESQSATKAEPPLE